MRECQACGCASWGDAREGALSSHMAEIVRLSDLARAEFVQCDNCGSVARRAYIHTPEPVFEAAGAMSDPMQIAKDLIMGAMPSSETRAERILRSLIQGRVDIARTNGEFAFDVMKAVRALDRGLSATQGSAEVPFYCRVIMPGSGLDDRFADRRALFEWALSGIDQAKEKVSEEGKPSDVNINRLAVHLINWLEAGAPVA